MHPMDAYRWARSLMFMTAPVALILWFTFLVQLGKAVGASCGDGCVAEGTGVGWAVGLSLGAAVLCTVLATVAGTAAWLIPVLNPSARRS